MYFHHLLEAKFNVDISCDIIHAGECLKGEKLVFRLLNKSKLSKVLAITAIIIHIVAWLTCCWWVEILAYGFDVVVILLS